MSIATRCGFWHDFRSLKMALQSERCHFNVDVFEEQPRTSEARESGGKLAREMLKCESLNAVWNGYAHKETQRSSGNKNTLWTELPKSGSESSFLPILQARINSLVIPRSDDTKHFGIVIRSASGPPGLSQLERTNLVTILTIVTLPLQGEWSILNFPYILTRNITSHSMKNLAFF